MMGAVLGGPRTLDRQRVAALLGLALISALPADTRAEPAAPSRPDGGTEADAGSDAAAASTEDDAGSDAAAASTEDGAAPSATSPTPESVAIAGSPPFVERRDDGELTGFSVELWKALSTDFPALAKAEPQYYESVDEALLALTEGRADLAVGPISITSERARRMSFSQPYYISSLSIAAPPTVSLWARLRPFASRAFGAGVLLLLLVLAGVGSLLWLAERKHNPAQFPRGAVAGIANGIWLALVTMTTVGYGDLAPVTRRGRVVAGVWMLVAMLTASSLTASIATALTLSQLETPGISRAAELDGRPVAALVPSPAADFVREHGGRVVAVEDVAQGVAAVLEGSAKAMVWDEPVLAYYLQKHPETELSLSATSYQPRGYGIAARHGAQTLLRSLDLGILQLTERGELERLRARWLPD